MAARRFFLGAVVIFLVSWHRVMASSGHGIGHRTMQQRHEEWISMYNRVYQSAEEKTKRFYIFKSNVEKIDRINKLRRGFILEENHLADLTDEEFHSGHRALPSLGRGPSPSASLPPPPRRHPPPLPRKSIPPPHRKPRPPPPRKSTPPPRRRPPPPRPSSFDWRRFGAVTPVKNGTACAAQWAYAVVAAVEAVVKIKTGKLTALSAQELVDCPYNEWGCGTPPNVFSMLSFTFRNIMRFGVHTEVDYPYTGEYSSCKRIPTVPTKISNFSYVPPNTETALEFAVTRQPVVVMLSTADARFYKSGVFEGPCYTPYYEYSHFIVALIGYGKEGNKTYWIAKNSWGVNWGENGYIRIRKDVEDPSGLCGMAKLLFYPIA